MMRDGQKDVDKLNGSYLSNLKFYDRLKMGVTKGNLSFDIETPPFYVKTPSPLLLKSPLKCN